MSESCLPLKNRVTSYNQRDIYQRRGGEETLMQDVPDATYRGLRQGVIYLAQEPEGDPPLRSERLRTQIDYTCQEMTKARGDRVFPFVRGVWDIPKLTPFSKASHRLITFFCRGQIRGFVEAITSIAVKCYVNKPQKEHVSFVKSLVRTLLW